MYRVGDIAKLIGVSVRTLHHYDQIGLLRPSDRSESGHRLYTDDDLLRLQQILTLRSLGFPLKQIQEVLARPNFDVAASLRIHRVGVRERISELEQVETVLGRLLDQWAASGEWTWDLVVEVAAAAQEAIAKEGQTMEKIRSLYTEEQLAQFAELGRNVSAAEIKAIEDGWRALMDELETVKTLDPASDEAQDFGTRWEAHQARTMSHYAAYPELTEAIRKNFEESRFRFEGELRGPQMADFALIERIKAARSEA
jgi:DNA-binding transcriptional MerR regulator